MPEQPLRSLVEAHIETQRGISGQEDLQSFQLTFRVGSLARGEEESVRVWVEQGGVQRTVQRRLLGSSEAGASLTTKIDAQPYRSAEEASRRLGEFLYLWTCGVSVDEQVQPLVERTLVSLRNLREYHGPYKDEHPLGVAKVYMYDHITDDQGAIDEVWRYRGRSWTQAGLRQEVLELPGDCTMFQIHLSIFDRIVGNAQYQVEQEIDWRTGKRSMLAVDYEFGACENIHRLFQDLYNTDEEFNTSVDPLS